MFYTLILFSIQVISTLQKVKRSIINLTFFLRVKYFSSMDRNNRLLYPTYSPYQNIFAQSSQLSSVSKSTSKYVPYTSQIYISKNSQYSKGSISSCTVMSLEAAIQLQDRVAPSANLAETILNIGSEYKDDRHTG